MTESNGLIKEARVNFSDESDSIGTPPKDLDRNLGGELKKEDEEAKGCWEKTRLFTGYAF